MDQNTASYQYYNYLDHLQWSEPRPRYEDAVAAAVRHASQAAVQDMNLKNIGPSLYDFYSSIGPAPAAIVYGNIPTETSPTSSDNSGTAGPTAQELETMLAEHKSKVSQINQAYQDGLMDWDTKSKALEDSRNTILGQRKQGMESNAAYFENVSPDAFQSQIGNYNTKVLDAYTQGSNTLDNNQKEIDYYKQKLDAGHKSDTGYYGSYDQGTGKYDAGAYVAPGVINAPTINSTIGNPYDQAAKLGVPSWAPNYGGMSVQQTAKSKEDEIQKFLG